MSVKKNNNFSEYLKSLSQNTILKIYLNNNICILAELSHFQFFDDYFIYDGKTQKGTMYFPDWKKIYPADYSPLSTDIGNEVAVPYSAISLVTEQSG